MYMSWTNCIESEESNYVSINIFLVDISISLADTSLYISLASMVVISFLFVLGTNGRMQPVVLAPKNLSTKH